MTFDRINRNFEKRGQKNKTQSFHEKAVHLVLKKYDRKIIQTKNIEPKFTVPLPKIETICCDVCDECAIPHPKDTDICHECYGDFLSFVDTLNHTFNHTLKNLKVTN